MIILQYWKESGLSDEDIKHVGESGFCSIVTLYHEFIDFEAIPLMRECIDNDPKMCDLNEDTLYEIHLAPAREYIGPMCEFKWAVEKVVKLQYSKDLESHHRKYIEL